jgi:hypothetical protein
LKHLTPWNLLQDKTCFSFQSCVLIILIYSIIYYFCFFIPLFNSLKCFAFCCLHTQMKCFNFFH